MAKTVLSPHPTLPGENSTFAVFHGLEFVAANVILGNLCSSILEMMTYTRSILVRVQPLFVSRLQFVTCMNLANRRLSKVSSIVA